MAEPGPVPGSFTPTDLSGRINRAGSIGPDLSGRTGGVVAGDEAALRVLAPMRRHRRRLGTRDELAVGTPARPSRGSRRARHRQADRHHQHPAHHRPHSLRPAQRKSTRIAPAVPPLTRRRIRPDADPCASQPARSFDPYPCAPPARRDGCGSRCTDEPAASPADPRPCHNRGATGFRSRGSCGHGRRYEASSISSLMSARTQFRRTRLRIASATVSRLPSSRQAGFQSRT